ncbi:MAG: cytochrome c oxidase subunit II [bacterium]|nr:cytochrome c oxidase subunit II [bacterium]
MTDSLDVLAMLKIVYTIYAFVAISLIAWFGYRLTRPGEQKEGSKSKVFWAYVIILVIVGTGLHFLTYNVIPWVPIDLNRAEITASKTFTINYKNHEMSFSELPMEVECNTYVVFDAHSADLTYGFGIFRDDHTLVTQMQVVPQSKNDLMWKFGENGTYYVRSTEYSGPKGASMIQKDAIVVSGCNADDINAKGTGGDR